MRAAWWWIDRWRKSTAYTDMSAEEQGVYRNLLDELWLRDGLIPANERILAKIGGDVGAWKRVRKAVLARFVLTPHGYRNETHDEIQEQTIAFREAQAERGRARWAKVSPEERSEQMRAIRRAVNDEPRRAGHEPLHEPDDEPPSPSPSLSLPLPRGEGGGDCKSSNTVRAREVAGAGPSRAPAPARSAPREHRTEEPRTIGDALRAAGWPNPQATGDIDPRVNP